MVRQVLGYNLSRTWTSGVRLKPVPARFQRNQGENLGFMNLEAQFVTGKSIRSKMWWVEVKISRVRETGNFEEWIDGKHTGSLKQIKWKIRRILLLVLWDSPIQESSLEIHWEMVMRVPSLPSTDFQVSFLAPWFLRSQHIWISAVWMPCASQSSPGSAKQRQLQRSHSQEEQWQDSSSLVFLEANEFDSSRPRQNKKVYMGRENLIWCLVSSADNKVTEGPESSGVRRLPYLILCDCLLSRAWGAFRGSWVWGWGERGGSYLSGLWDPESQINQQTRRLTMTDRSRRRELTVSFNPVIGGCALLTVTWGPRDTRFPNLIRQITEQPWLRPHQEMCNNRRRPLRAVLLQR